MSVTKEALLAFKGAAPTPVDVDGLGRVYIRIMSGTERDAFEAETYRLNGKNVELNRENFRARLLVKTLADENGNRLLSDGEAAKLGELPSTVLIPLADKASEVNGMTAKDIEALAKNS